jgi:predicted unusual protein kinase regulating ubiquinone biosynthesis (AarF/ABC1/UbiB family)
LKQKALSKPRSRFFRILFVFFRIILDFNKEFNIAKKKGFKYAQTKMFKTHEKRSKELYSLAISLGGVLIKLCQYFSTRRDIFPEPYVNTLQSLQDQVPPVPFEEIEKILHIEYPEFDKIFKCVDPAATASASLGQVHRAELISGKDVVLKILKPGIQEVIDTDFSILYHVFRIFSNFKIFKDKFDFFEVLDEFIRITGDELNFRREIFVSKELKKRLSHLHYLKIPYVYEEISTRKVIVMEYCSGDKITEKDKWGTRNNDPLVLSKRIIEIYMEQFINIRLIHFDPHPGNILVTDDNNLVLLDFGMSGEITDKMSNGIKAGLKAFLTKDYMKIIEVLDDLGFIKKGANKYKLLSVLEFFFSEVITTAMNMSMDKMQAIDLSPVIDDLVELLYTQPIKLPVEWAFMGRTIGTLAGIVSSLDPELNIYKEFEPYAKKMLSSGFDEIFDQAKDTIKDFTLNFIQLPKKINDTVIKIEKGDLKFKVDFEEIDGRLDDIRNLVVRLAALGISIVSFIGFYVLFFLDMKEPSYFLAGSGTLLLIFSFFRRSRKGKDEIRKRILDNKNNK